MGYSNLEKMLFLVIVILFGQIVILSGKSSKGNIDFASKIIFRDFSTKISSSLFVPTFSFEASYILPACKGISEFIITHTNLEEE